MQMRSLTVRLAALSARRSLLSANRQREIEARGLCDMFLLIFSPPLSFAFVSVGSPFRARLPSPTDVRGQRVSKA